MQHAAGLREQAAPVGEMLDQLEGGDQIECSFIERKVRRGDLHKVRGAIVLRRIFNRLWGDVHADGFRSAARKFGGTIAGTTTQIEDSLPCCQTRCERIAGDVFGPQVIFDLAGDNALACELTHSATAPAPIL